MTETGTDPGGRAGKLLTALRELNANLRELNESMERAVVWGEILAQQVVVLASRPAGGENTDIRGFVRYSLARLLGQKVFGRKPG